MLDLELTEIKELTKIINEKFGYDFSGYALSSFKRRLQRIMDMNGFSSLNQLQTKIITQTGYFNEFLSEITVNVTEMFRDPSFWTALQYDVLEKIFKERESIKVWHAGCSSGEEVFSLAILLDKMGKLDSTSFFATDIDQTIISSAKKGQYSIKNLETFKDNYEEVFGKGESPESYYQVKDNYFEMDSRLQENVLYRTHNLTSLESFSKFDIILCRNVLIYFNQNQQSDVLKMLRNSLFKPGYLCIGSKESLLWSEDASNFTELNKEERIYKKVN